ncbi:von Willebrand factor type A domain protein [Ceratocystis lukuohia]|uniref:von Willebrand factor type A domain protein n=1 Tax=Ceratocystis lukuohia TaxID=2019550 RepID=A0ABR4MBF0_9PEZI
MHFFFLPLFLSGTSISANTYNQQQQQQQHQQQQQQQHQQLQLQPQPQYHTSQERNPSIASGVTGQQAMSSSDRSRGRRERTFVGSECAVCEEPLEHTLRGERILQFSCTHVAHEACFYALIKEFESQYCPTCDAPLHLDTSRGGNVIDIEKISNMVRSPSTHDSRSQATTTPTPGSGRNSAANSAWDAPPPPSPQAPLPVTSPTTARFSGTESNPRNTAMSMPGSLNGRDTRDRDGRDTRDSSTARVRDPSTTRARDSSQSGGERYTLRSTTHTHQRSDSEVTGAASTTSFSNGYPETTQSGPSRRHDYDVQAMETTISSPRPIARNPIPHPTVIVRSEFPTINRSRQQQSITCLITVEVPDNKWQADPEDLGVPIIPLPQPVPVSTARSEDSYARPLSPVRTAPRFYPYESREVLDEITENLRNRVDNWHGLDFGRFGRLRLYGTLRVGKDRVSWQELECYLFAEMLICVKEKKINQQMAFNPDDAASGLPKKTTRCTLKGSILIKKHLNEVLEIASPDEISHILTLSLSVAELPQFHLKFENRNQLKLWQQALLDLNAVEASPVRSPEYDRRGAGDYSEVEDDDWGNSTTSSSTRQRVSSVASWGVPKSSTPGPADYANSIAARTPPLSMQASVHVPIDVVVVVPISSSMQGVKINLVRDALRFMVSTLGERDRMGLVTFGSGGGGVPIVGMTTKAWHGWSNVLGSIKPVGQKSHRADVVEGANVAMDLLMQRKYNNPIATIMLISDASTSDADSVDFVVSRAEAAKITIHSFGLGMTHKPDTMIELSTRTKASYTYVKDWMMLRECLAGCLGSMQSLSHQNVKLKLKLPEGSPAKFHKISGALQITKRAAGRDAEASLGDLRFGDRRDVLVQLVIMPDNATQEALPQDTWDTLVSGLEALGGNMDSDEQRTMSVEEVPLIQADLTWGDILRDGTLTHMPRPSLLAITMLPASNNKKSWAMVPPIPPHPGIVQRRMELLTAWARVVFPLSPPPNRSTPPDPCAESTKREQLVTDFADASPRSSDGLGLNVGIDPVTVAALDAELEASLEWINHPAVFGRDSRKAVLQAIGVISSQRAFTFRSSIEALWAGRVSGVKKLTGRSREWRDEGGGEGGIMEEA